MIRLGRILTALLILALAAAGCSKAGKEPPVQRVEANKGNDSIKIYASFYPMYFLASEIAADKAEVISMVPAGAEPHDWEPTPKLVIELGKADMLVYNGAGMETWIDNLLSNINREKTKVVDASEGIELLKDEDLEHGGVDPHIWVSPMRVRQQARTIFEALKEIDPESSEYYSQNWTELDSRLAKLDEDIKAAAGAFKSNVIVVSHEAFGYLAKDYGLEQMSIRGINPQDEPSLNKMKELAKLCREKNVKYIFFEQLTSPKLSETLAREVGAGTLVLNDAAGLSEEDIKSGKDYITVMYENLENLKKALGE